MQTVKSVYLIKSVDNQLYKIGVASNPSKRLMQLQTGSPEELKLVYQFKSEFASKIETSLHNRYSFLHKINEWFSYDVQIEVDFIKECEKIHRNLVIINSHKFLTI